MSKIILISCALVVAQALDATLFIDKELKACAKELNVKNAKNALQDETTDPNAKCLKHCIALKLKQISEDGTPILDNAPTDSSFTEYSQDCAKQHKEADKCERVNRFSTCVNAKSEQLIKIYSNQCANDTNTKMDTIKDLNNNPFAVLNVKLHCYLRCMMMKLKVMDADGNIDIGRASSSLMGTRNEKLIELVKVCTKQHNETDVCKKSAQRVICVGQRYLVSSLIHKS